MAENREDVLQTERLDGSRFVWNCFPATRKCQREVVVITPKKKQTISARSYAFSQDLVKSQRGNQS